MSYRWRSISSTRSIAIGLATLVLYSTVLGLEPANAAWGGQPAQVFGGSDGDWQYTYPDPGYSRFSYVVYDSQRDRMIMSLGYSTTYLSWWLHLRGHPTWEPVPFNGAPEMGYADGAFIYDPVGDRIVLFGGRTGSSNPHTDQLWSRALPSGPWVQSMPVGYTPASRSSTSGIYDPVRHRMVVFGGVGESVYNDVAALDLGPIPAWDSLDVANPSPSPRFDHTAIYDSARDRMVVFGGNDGVQRFNDVWALDFSGTPTWTLLSTGGPELSRAAAVFDSDRDRMVVFGGESAAGPTGATWAMDLATGSWSSLPTLSPPIQTILNSAAIYDPIDQRLIVHGWFNGADVWVLPLDGPAAWTELYPGRFGRWSDHSAVRAPDASRMIFFGGSRYSTWSDETWIYHLEYDNWGSVDPVGSKPPRRSSHSAISDAANDRMIVFGGTHSYSPRIVLGDLWSLPFTGAPVWTELVQSGDLPGPRFGHVAIYDPPRERMLLFGGGGSDSSVYSLSLTGAAIWTRETPAGTGPGTAYSSAIHDPFRSRMLVLTESGVWALSLIGPMTWTLLPTAGTPPQEHDFLGETTVYDSERDRILMFNGGTTYYFDREIFELSLTGAPTWRKLAPTGGPPIGNVDGAAIYDVLRDRMVYHGGVSWSGAGGPYYDNDLWTLNFERVVSVPPSTAAVTSVGIKSVRPNPGRASHAFEIESTAMPTNGRIEVLAVTGQRVWTRPLGDLPAGRQWVTWDGRRTDGTVAPPGIYLVRVSGPGNGVARRFVRIR